MKSSTQPTIVESLANLLASDVPSHVATLESSVKDLPSSDYLSSEWRKLPSLLESCSPAVAKGSVDNGPMRILFDMLVGKVGEEAAANRKVMGIWADILHQARIIKGHKGHSSESEPNEESLKNIERLLAAGLEDLIRELVEQSEVAKLEVALEQSPSQVAQAEQSRSPSQEAQAEQSPSPSPEAQVERSRSPSQGGEESSSPLQQMLSIFQSGFTEMMEKNPAFAEKLRSKNTKYDALKSLKGTVASDSQNSALKRVIELLTLAATVMSNTSQGFSIFIKPSTLRIQMRNLLSKTIPALTQVSPEGETAVTDRTKEAYVKALRRITEQLKTITSKNPNPPKEDVEQRIMDALSDRESTTENLVEALANIEPSMDKSPSKHHQPR